MAVSLADIDKQAQKLAAEERAELAERLLDSLRSPVSSIESAWSEEIEARVAAFDRGEMQAYAAEEVFAEARSLSR
jgi:putative addiction module component (TIGR02574 family)